MENTTAREQLLQEALKTVKELAETRKEYAEAQRRFRESERRLDALKKKIEAQKESDIRTKRAELETEYEKLLRAAEEKIGDAEKRRKGARTDAMKERIRKKTEMPRNEIKELREKIRKNLKEDKLPRFCGSEFYSFMFMPSGIADILKMAGVFVLALVAVPALIILLIKPVWAKVLTFALIDLAFIGLYLLIYRKTAAKKPKTLSACKELLKKIRAEKKEIAGTTRKIVKDPDDSYYNLNSYDAELTKFNQEKNDIVRKKQEALQIFESETAAQIKAEADAAGAEELDKAKQEFDSGAEETRKLAELIAGAQRMLEETYGPVIGEKSLTPEGIEQLMAEEKIKQRTDPEGPAPETKG